MSFYSRMLRRRLLAAMEQKSDFVLAANGAEYRPGDTLTLYADAQIQVTGFGSVELTLVGGGGGGGGAYTYSNNSRTGGGGGSGGMSIRRIPLEPGLYKAVVGLGGAAGSVASSAPDDSRDGGDSSFAGILAGGGKRGSYGKNTPGKGGEGGTGDLPGNPGAEGNSGTDFMGAAAAPGGASLHPAGYGKGGDGNAFGSMMGGSSHVTAAATKGADGVVIISVL